MGIFSKLTGPKITFETIKKTDDQKELEEMANKTTSVDLKKAAIKKITDIDILKGFVNSSEELTVINRVISQISDVNVLKEIVLNNSQDTKLKRAANTALAKIVDESILYDILLSSPVVGIKKTCLSKIKDQAWLKKIVENEKSKTIKAAAQKELDKHRVIITFMKIEFLCPHCSQPVFVNGPIQSMSCPFCTSQINMDTNFWKGVLKEAFASGFTSLGYMWGVKGLDVKTGIKNVRCQKCKEKLKIPSEIAQNQNTLVCPHCNYENALLPAPDWMKKLCTSKPRKPQLIIGGEDEHYEENFYKSVKPVVISCLKCGGNLEINTNTPRNATCSYCGTVQFLPDPLWFSLHPVKTRKEWFIQWSESKKK